MAKIGIFFVGDFCSLVPPVDVMVDPELTSLIREADISVCNFETPVKPQANTIAQDPTFNSLCQSAESVGFLEGLGFDLFSLANNHAFDYGDEGFQETQRRFKKGQVVGAGNFEDAYRVKVLEAKGLKVGFLALTYASFGVFDHTSDGKGLGCAYINHPSVNHIVQNSKSDVDVLIVLAHDGIEYTDAPTHSVRARYHDLIDFGADAVVACHPHCPQGWEEYKGHPIFYSLGNFFFNSKKDPYFRTTLPFWYNGMAVCLSIDTEAKGIAYRVYNTVVKGRSIAMDETKEIKDRNRYLCALLKDERLFEDYWNRVVRQLFKEKYIPFCEYTFNTQKKQNGFKGLVKSLFRLFRHKNNNISFKRFFFIIRSDTEREVFLKGLKMDNNYN